MAHAWPLVFFEVPLNSTESSAPAKRAVTTRAVDSPLVRGGLTIVAGVLTGNLLGVGRVALIAYLLGTHSYADSLAVALGPLDTFNSVLINSIVFAFVPMLTAAQGEQRTALFLKLSRCFVWALSLTDVYRIARLQEARAAMLPQPPPPA